MTGLHAVLDKEMIARSQISYRNLVSSHYYQRLNRGESDIAAFYDRHGSSLETWALNSKAWEVIDSTAKQSGLPKGFVLLWEKEPVGTKQAIIYLDVDGLNQVVSIQRFSENVAVSSNWIIQHIVKP